MPRRSILVVTENLPHVDNPYLGSYLVTTLRRLAERHRVAALVPTHVPLRRRLAPHGAPIALPGVELVRVPMYPLSLIALRRAGLLSRDTFFLLAKRRLRSVLRQPALALHARFRFDLVHGQEVLAGDEAIPIARALHIPALVSIHGLASYHAALLGPRTMAEVKSHLRQADALSAASEVARASYRAAGVDHPRFEVIANALDRQAATELPEPWRTRLRGRRVLLCVGFLVESKRPAAMIHLARALGRQEDLRDVVTVFVGHGELEGTLRRQAGAEGVSDVVLFAGRRPPAEMAAWYSACAMLVHPSVSEAFSMACLEAAGAARPVVCTEGAAVGKELDDAGAAVVVPPDDAPALERAVRALLVDPERRRTMGEAGARLASRFTPEAQGAAFEALYDGILG